MPSGDRSGPMGAGPRTGRAMGLCAGNEVAGFATAGGWGGFGRGRGFRRRNRFYATGLTGWQRAAGVPAAQAGPAPEAGEPTATADQQLEALTNQVAELRQALADIQQQLAAMQDQPKD